MPEGIAAVQRTWPEVCAQTIPGSVITSHRTGVLQCLGPGPGLFNIFINDLGEMEWKARLAHAQPTQSGRGPGRAGSGSD